MGDRGRPSGIVIFQNFEDAKKALEMRFIQVFNCSIEVTQCEPEIYEEKIENFENENCDALDMKSYMQG